MEKKLKHLEFIQNTINRMASNLFLMPILTIGWMVPLAVTLIANPDQDSLSNEYILYFPFPLIILWFLHGYYLRQERLFRCLYNKVRKLDEEKIDFSMDIKEYEDKWRNTLLGSMLSLTSLSFYGIPVVSYCAILYWDLIKFCVV